MSDSSIETKISNLISWGESNGCQIDPRIKFIYNNDGSGVSAILNVPDVEQESDDQDIVIDISNDVILTPEAAYESLKEVIPVSVLDSFDGFQVLQIYLTYLRYNNNYMNSKWFNYIDLLPIEINSPLIWSLNDLNLYLSNTNLINGCHLKLIEIYKKFLNFKNLLNLSEQQDEHHDDDDDIEYIHNFYHSNSDSANWFNFKSYLWSYLIITSRSFPYKLIHNLDNNNSNNSKFNKLNSVILLPIIDLLNHKPKSKVYWNGNINNEKNFKFTKLIKDYKIEVDSNDNNDLQIYNNYGPKGNEELFMGYGFTIKDNEFDTLLLSLNISQKLNDLQNDTTNKLIKNFNLFLPTLESYTNSIVDDDDDEKKIGNDTIKINDNPIYISNINHIIPKGLLELYCFLNRKENDDHITLNSLFNSINDLRKSLNMKYKNKLNITTNIKENNFNEINSNNYKIGQLNLYNLFIKDLKILEKNLLKIYRKNLIIKKDLIKKSIKFNEFLKDPNIYDDDFISNELYFIIWILYIVNPPIGSPDSDSDLESFRPDWIIAKFKEYSNNDTTEYQVHDIINPILFKYWSEIDFQIANKILLENSYLKGSNEEIILIESDIIIKSIEEFI